MDIKTNMIHPEFFENILKGVLESSQFHFKDRLLGIVLFGSTVKQLKKATDIDLFIILESLSGKNEMFDAIEKIETDCEPRILLARQLGFDLHLSIKMKSKNSALKFNPLYLDWVDTSRVVYDGTDKIVELILSKTKAYILEVGAKKIQKGLFWYWDLAPGLKYNEVRKIGW